MSRALRESARKPVECEPEQVTPYPLLPSPVRPLFPEAPYDREEYLSAVSLLFDVTGAFGILLILSCGFFALIFLTIGEIFPMIVSVALAWVAWLWANVARDVLEARYRAVLMMERGMRRFDEFLTRDCAGRMACHGHVA